MIEAKPGSSDLPASPRGDVCGCIMRQRKTLLQKIEPRIARETGDDVFLPREFA
jgi:hypothetical protein